MKRHTIYSILLLPLLLLSLASCDKYIYDRGECPTILVFTPYMQTPCMSDSAYIGKSAALHLVVSDPTSGEIIAYKHLESSRSDCHLRDRGARTEQARGYLSLLPLGRSHSPALYGE